MHSGEGFCVFRMRIRWKDLKKALDRMEEFVTELRNERTGA